MEDNKNLEGQVQQNQEPENKPEEHEMTLEEAQSFRTTTIKLLPKLLITVNS